MEEILKKKIEDRTAIVGVIGVGYIGLSLLEAYGNAGFQLRGFDVSQERMELLNRRKSYLNFMPLTSLFKLMDEGRFKASSNPDVLDDADILVISVPTTLDEYHNPDLTNLRAAFKTVRSHLKKDQLVILQSSTYPGTTEEELLPLLASENFKVGEDFFLAHVPEIADPGNEKFSFSQIPRIVSGITPRCLELAAMLYESLGCETFKVSSPKVAEAAKLLQNGYRLVNISFINEMKVMLEKMGIDVWEVIEAADSKPFGFQRFNPSPGAGGDCIPIAPFYMVWKARATKGPTTLLDLSGHINDKMPLYTFNKIAEGLNEKGLPVKGSKVLVLGVSYKRNVNDTRESPAIDILRFLKEHGAEVEYNDPYVEQLKRVDMKNTPLDYDKLDKYDAVVIATDHDSYQWEKVLKNSSLIIDCRNALGELEGTKSKVIKA
ncbi:MAG: nucleotide sugar dehydrogenase [Chlamydiia bacterium]|nr:nucleotide sugar dehydrogenase [Chlamydiia bacterium]